MKAARTKPARTCAELGVCHGRPTMGCTCRPSHNDSGALPPDGFFFAPGAIEHGPRRARRISPLGRLVLWCVGTLAASSLIGFAAGVLQAKGWPL
ncbi:MAG: hypothetical protein ACTS8S_00155 [Giesbergeria sp.]